ncbi:MAG: ABC transporter ATP-binding protein [Lautropia sp.]
MNLLTIEALVCGYGDADIVRGAGMVVRAQEIVTIVGANGAGKSTLLKAVVGTIRIRSGRVQVGDREIHGLPAQKIARLGVGYVPQVRSVFPSLTVAENLRMGTFAAGPRQACDDVLELFPRLRDKRRVRAGHLSGGERQMLAIATALIPQPRVLLLDEPSAALAPVMVDAVFDRIDAINRLGVSVLMVEQRVEEALAMSHRTYVMVDGRVTREAASAELAADGDLVQLFLGAQQ